MKDVLQKSGHMLTYCGILSFCFGVLVLVWPSITLIALVWLFAIPVIAQGVSYLVAAFNYNQHTLHWIILLLIGVINIAGGLLVIIYPGITAVFLIKVMGATWFTAGVLQIAAAIRLRREIRSEHWLVLAGGISVLVGVYVLANPESSALAMLWLIAIYAVLFGIVMVIFGFKTRTWYAYYDEDIVQ